MTELKVDGTCEASVAQLHDAQYKLCPVVFISVL